MPNKKIIAFYLPQFHPIPENDEWWGKGFTEWTNTAKAKPLFKGHIQPNVPADLGFYDLRNAESRLAQAELAKEYGIHGFCYYHYWFAGKRIIEHPFNEVLESGEPDFPFCLCWANQTWTGIWHGAPNKVLIEQTYPGMEDHKAHFFTLLKAFTDPRYINVDNKPLLLIYRPQEIPDIVKVMDLWRNLALESGLKGLHLVGVSHIEGWKPEDLGLDAAVAQRIPARTGAVSWDFPLLKLQSLFKKLPTIYSYKSLVDFFVTRDTPDYESYPCVVPNWDNSPRSGTNGLVIQGSTPELFRPQLTRALKRVEELPDDHQLVFLKSWNEWAEGNYVEPDHRFGKQYLEVIKDELNKS